MNPIMTPINSENGDNRLCDISFKEKIRIFSHDYLKACIYVSGQKTPRHTFTKRLYSVLISSSRLLEDLLDVHGAKNNQNWFYYRELSAAIRHLSLAGYAQRHIATRIPFYKMPDSEDFEKRGDEAFDFINNAIMKLAPVVLREARRLEVPFPDRAFKAEDFPGITTGEILADDIEDRDIELQKKHIVRLSNEFLSVAVHFDDLDVIEPLSMAEIKRLVPDRVNEEGIRRYEMLVHNLQSSFDTYVGHSGLRYIDEKLKNFRNYFSVVLHLLEIMGRLLHFCERHLLDPGFKSIYKRAQENLSELIDPDMILEHTVNFGLLYVCHYLNKGRDLAREILNENIERSYIVTGIPKNLGFHLRPSLLVAKIVQYYGGQVELVVGPDRFDASSVLDLQWAGGKIQKEQIDQVRFEGDKRALRDIEILAGVNYGENLMGKGIPLPPELHYLKSSD